jgi:hypothetical protein
MAEMRRLGEPGPEFNPRLAALVHAGTAARMGMGHGTISDTAMVGEIAQAIACGLVYVGDQIGRLADGQTATAATTKAGGADGGASE